jgi:transcription initiation factor TFIIIB Brf1 subunit/transcription initiation factor TFIIB
MFQAQWCHSCGANTVIAPDGQMVCVSCGCVEAVFDALGKMADTHEGTDSHSFDNGKAQNPSGPLRASPDIH